MSIVYPQAFRRSPSAGFDGIFDWDFLKPAFAGSTCDLMDFDAVVERNGLFLVIETKEGNKPIPKGQQIAFESAVRTGFFTIIVLRGKAPEDINGWDCWFWGKNSGRIQKKHEDGDADSLVAFVRRWFRKASERKLAGER